MFQISGGFLWEGVVAAAKALNSPDDHTFVTKREAALGSSVRIFYADDFHVVEAGVQVIILEEPGRLW